MSAPSIEDEKYYTGDISGKKHVFRADVQSSLDHSILIAPSMAGSPMAIEPFSTCCRKLYGKCKALSFLSSIVTRVNSYATLAAAPSQDLTQNRHWDAVRKRNTKEVLNIWPEIRLTKISCISSFSAGCLIEWLSQHRSRDAAMWYLIRETEVVLLLPHLVMTNICTYPQSGNN